MIGRAIAPLARKIGEEVAENIGKAAAKSSKAPKPKPVKVKAPAKPKTKPAQEPVKEGDDWGWKGGKPGEVTGGELTKIVKKVDNLTTQQLRSPSKAARKLFDSYDRAATKFSGQLESAEKSGKLNLPPYSEPERIAKQFSALEKADIPREWTGKLHRAIMKRPRSSRLDYFEADALNSISNSMRSMTNQQRKIFLEMLPDWDGTIDDLADVVRTLD